MTNKKALLNLNRIVQYVSLPFFILGLLLPVYGKEIGASVIEIGLFFSVFSIMTVLLRPVIGWGLDRIGRRPFFLAGVVCYALAMLGFAFINEVWGVLLARVLQGAASSLVWLSAYAMIADLTEREERGSAFGSLAESSARGSILGAFIGFVLLQARFSWNGAVYTIGSWFLLFIVYALVNLLALGYSWRSLSETNHITPIPESGRMMWSRPWVLLLMVTLVTGASWAMVSPVLIIFLQERLNIGVETLAWAFLPTGLIWAFLPAQLGKLSDRFGRKPLMILGLVMASASSFVVPWLSSILAFTMVWAFQALCYAAGDPAEQALVADLTGGDRNGLAYGYYALAADLGFAIGPLGGAFLYQAYNPAAPFYANGVLLAACALVLLVFLKEPGRP